MGSVQINPDLKIAYQDILKGLSKSSLPDLEEFLNEVSTLIARKKVKNLSEREIELIKIIYQKQPVEFKEKYDLLYQKLQSETISDEEHEELLKLMASSENYNNQWLEALVELAQLRGVTIFELKKQLGIENFDPTK
ncbi:MAG: hypothetical protein R2825_29180 [Saprospiraceae bacterium]